LVACLLAYVPRRCRNERCPETTVTTVAAARDQRAQGVLQNLLKRRGLEKAREIDA
jgi:hypothetical protein